MQKSEREILNQKTIKFSYQKGGNAFDTIEFETLQQAQRWVEIRKQEYFHDHHLYDLKELGKHDKGYVMFCEALDDALMNEIRRIK